MNLVLLGGNSKRNELWIKNISEQFQDMFQSCKVQSYSHWADDKQGADFELEYRKLVDTSKDLEPFAIFAKSMGTLLALRGITEKTINPSYCLLVGIPLSMIRGENVDLGKWSKAAQIPIIVAQNKSDPLGTYQEVNEFIKNKIGAHIKVFKLSGDTHDYDDIASMKQLLASLAL